MKRHGSNQVFKGFLLLFYKMIGFLMYNGLCYYYLKTGNTKNVIKDIQNISQYGSCIIYLILAFLFWNFGIYSIVILYIATFETLVMCILPILKTSAAFELVRIDYANKGWIIDERGFGISSSLVTSL